MQQPPGRTQDVACPAEAPPLDLGAWLAGRVSYADWRRRRAPPSAPEVPPLPGRDERLAATYTARWKDKVTNTYRLLTDRRGWTVLQFCLGIHF